MVKTWEQLVKDYKEVDNMPIKPSFSMLDPDYILDVDKSVRWNREQVEINNSRYNEELIENQYIKSRKMDDVLSDIYDYIVDEAAFGMTRRAARCLWNYAWDLGHAHGLSDVKIYLDELIDLYRDIEQAKSYNNDENKSEEVM